MPTLSEPSDTGDAQERPRRVLLVRCVWECLARDPTGARQRALRSAARRRFQSPADAFARWRSAGAGSRRPILTR